MPKTQVTPPPPSHNSPSPDSQVTWRHQWRLLWPLALPVMLSQFAANALSLIATAVLGRLGPSQLAAAGFAQSLYYLFFLVLVGTMLAVPPRMAKSFGASDYAGLRLNLQSGLTLATLLSLVFLPSVWLLLPLLPRIVPAGINADYAMEFLRIYSLGMWAMLLAIPLRGVLEATGHAAIVTAISFGMVMVALLASPALTFGWGVLPELGLLGAALGSVLAGFIGMLALWPLAMRRLASLSATKLSVSGMSGVSGPDPAARAASTERQATVSGLSSWRDNWRQGHVWADLKSTLNMGISIGLTLGIEGGLFSISSLLMAQFGEQTLAAHEITMKIITALFMIPLGIASATSLRVGQEYGAGNLGVARRAGLLGMAASVAVMLCFALLYWLAPHLLIGFFIEVQDAKNAEVIKITISFLGIAALFQAVDGIQVTAASALRGLQDTRWPFVISLVSYWLVGLTSGVLLSFGLDLGGQGLWYGMLIGLSLAALLLLWRFFGKTTAASS